MRQHLNKANRAVNAVSQLLFWLATAVILVMAVHVFLSVCNRMIVGREIAGTLEFTAFYYMPALVFLPLPYLDEVGGHVRADLVSWLPATPARYLEAATRLALAVFFAVIGWYGFTNALDKTLASEVTRSAGGFIPVWIGRWAIPVAAALATVHSVIAMGRALAGEQVYSAGAETKEPV